MITGLIIIAIVIWLFYMAIKLRKAFGKFVKENNVTVTKKSNKFKDGKIIVFDEKENNLWVFRHEPFKQDQISFPVSAITGCELKINNETNFHTSLGSTAGRAIVGGLLFGGVGAIIGGVTGKRKGNTRVHEMELIISTIDLDNPYVSIIAFQNKRGARSDSASFRAQLDNVRYWCKFIEAVIERQKAPTV